MLDRRVRLPLWLTSLTFGLTLVLGGVGGFIGTNPMLASSTAVAPATTPALQTTFAPAVQKVMPSIVNVFSSRKVKNEGNASPFFDDPVFRRFFGDDLRRPIPRDRQERSL